MKVTAIIAGSLVKFVFFTVLSIVLIACTPENSYGQTAQDFILPPQINLIQHSNFASSFHPVRYARIWGWSANGRVAYSIEGGLNSETGYQIDFVILDLITNNVLFNFTDFSGSANNWVEGEALFYVHKTSILGALRTYEIIDQRTDFLPFPLIKNNIAYYAEIIDIEYGEDEHWQLGDTILRYTLSLTVDNRRKMNLPEASLGVSKISH